MLLNGNDSSRHSERGADRQRDAIIKKVCFLSTLKLLKCYLSDQLGITRNYRALKVRFELVDLDANLAKSGDFERSLTCYVKSTAVSERTDTREIAHWYGVPAAERCGIKFYSLRINGAVAGYAQARYISNTQVMILDYLCIEPQQESNAAYFSFIELFCVCAESVGPISYIVTELTFNLDSKSKDEPNRYWLRVLEMVGFKVAQLPYLQPSLTLDAPNQVRNGALLIRSNEKSTQMSNETYLSIIENMYFDHYIAWYGPFRSNLTPYRNILKKEIISLTSNLKKSRYITLNGSLKHNNLVPAEESEPSLNGKIIYLLITFAFIFIIAIASVITALATWVGLGLYASIVIVLVSLLTFAGLIALFIPSRLQVVKDLSRPIWRLFSGL